MGTGSSFPRYEDDFDLDDEPGVIKNIPNEIKPRGTLRALRSVGSFGRSAKGVSLLSTQSVQLANTEVEKVKKELKMKEISMKNELEDFSKKVTKLENENCRLRGELQALQKSCDKLRGERDLALEAKYQALGRAGSFETERNKVQKQFKLYREGKESEIRELMKTRQHLETALQRVDPDALLDVRGKEMHVDGNVSGDWWAAFNSEPSIGSTSDVHPWQRPFSGFHFGLGGPESLMESKESGLPPIAAVQTFKSYALPAQSNLIKVYITASHDLQDELLTICNKCEKKLRSLCESQGKMFSLVHFKNQSEEEISILNIHEVKKKELKVSSIFVALVSGSFDGDLMDECKNGYLSCPGERKVIVSIYETSNSVNLSGDSGFEDFKNSVLANEAVLIDDTLSGEEKQSRLISSLEDLVKNELGIETTQSTDSDSGFHSELDSSLEDWTGRYNWDQHDYSQQEALQRALDAQTEVGLDHLYDRLNEHILAAGPLPPLIIFGPSGSGKTFLLAKWLTFHQKRNPSCLVLHHFVGSPISTSACVVSMIRRLMVQIVPHLSNPPVLTSDPARLLEEFPQWLEKISSRFSDGLVLVIDSIDHLQNKEENLSWLLDPLPVDARVIVSGRPESCPEIWRSWPSLTLPEIDYRHVTEFITASSLLYDCPIPIDLEKQIILHAKNQFVRNPLFLTVIIHAAFVSAKSNNYDFHQGVFQDSSLEELFLSIFEDLRNFSKSLDSFLLRILELILCARNGLSESEIFDLVPKMNQDQWFPLFHFLVNMQILVMKSGVITFKHEVVRNVVQTFCSRFRSELQIRKEELIIYFQQYLSYCKVSERVADELPWLLHSTNQLPQLKESITHMGVFRCFYSRGRSSELLKYWEALGVDRPNVAKKYFDQVKEMESEHYEGPVTLPAIADLYEMLGKFLMDLGLLNQAVWSFQRALEIRESIDPDHPAVGQCFYLLGNLHAQWRKFTTAEVYFKQALMVYEGFYGTDHIIIPIIFESLALLSKKQARYDAAENYMKSSNAIRKRVLVSEMHPFNQKSSTGVSKRIHQLQEGAKSAEGIERGNILYELGVLYYWQKDFKQAEDCLEQVMTIFESSLKPGDLKQIQPLISLSAIHEAANKFDKLENVYLRILEVCQAHGNKDLPVASNAARNLALLYKKQGKYNQAEPLYKDALDKEERIFGENHPKTAAALVNLAILYCQQGNHGDALPLLQRALKIYEEQFGPNHQRVAETLRNLAVLHFEQGDEKQATEFYKRANEIKELESSTARSRMITPRSGNSSPRVLYGDQGR